MVFPITKFRKLDFLIHFLDEFGKNDENMKISRCCKSSYTSSFCFKEENNLN